MIKAGGNICAIAPFTDHGLTASLVWMVTVIAVNQPIGKSPKPMGAKKRRRGPTSFNKCCAERSEKTFDEGDLKLL